MNQSADGSVKRKTLIVDDDESLLGAMARAFTEAGETVVAKSTFEQARQALREEKFDALVTDVRLGAFNGIQLIVIAREINPAMKLIVFSGFDDPVLKAEADHVGAVYLLKPVASSVILDLIRGR